MTVVCMLTLVDKERCPHCADGVVAAELVIESGTEMRVRMEMEAAKREVRADAWERVVAGAAATIIDVASAGLCCSSCGAEHRAVPRPPPRCSCGGRIDLVEQPPLLV